MLVEKKRKMAKESVKKKKRANTDQNQLSLNL